MRPKSHFLFGLLLTIVLYFLFPEIGIINLAIFLISTVGIDVDHYLYYVYKKKDWNLKRSFNWFVSGQKKLRKADLKYRKEFYSGFCFLHGVEILLILFLLGYFVWYVFYFVLLGFFFHLILDHIHQAFWRGRFDKFSILYDYWKYKKLKFIDEFEGIGEDLKRL